MEGGGGKAGYARRSRASGRGFGGLCAMITGKDGGATANRDILWRWGGTLALYFLTTLVHG